MLHTQTINATEFKAKCLDILDRLSTFELDEVIITKRGKTVAILTPPKTQAEAVKSLHGFMRGSVVIPASIDLTAPIGEEEFDVNEGSFFG